MQTCKPNEGQTSILITKTSNTYSKLVLAIWVALFPGSPMCERSVTGERGYNMGVTSNLNSKDALPYTFFYVAQNDPHFRTRTMASQ